MTLTRRSLLSGLAVAAGALAVPSVARSYFFMGDPVNRVLGALSHHLWANMAIQGRWYQHRGGGILVPVQQPGPFDLFDFLDQQGGRGWWMLGTERALEQLRRAPLRLPPGVHGSLAGGLTRK